MNLCRLHSVYTDYQAAQQKIFKKILLIFVFVFLLELQVKSIVVPTVVSKPKHQYGSPLNILQFEQVGNKTKVVVDDQALNGMFLHPEVKNRKVVIVSIVGAFRKGKSFFMDYYLKFMFANYKSVNFMNNPINNTANWMGASDDPLTGFSWKSGQARDTTGIILWSDVFLATNAIGEKLAIILIDTQGLFDSKTSPADNSRIFALGTLISSVQIFNLNDVIQENQLEYLQLATDFAKLAAKNNQQSFATKPFQKLLFLIRDWKNAEETPYGFEGGKSYIMDNLKIEENQHESLTSVREYIFSSFEEISCCLLPDPGRLVKRANYDGSWSKMEDDFRDELKSLVETLLDPKNLVIKKINNHELTAVELKSYIEVYFKAFQSNEIVGAQSLYETTVAEQMNILIQQGLQTYKEHLANAKRPNMTDFVEILISVHSESKQKSIDQFTKANKMVSAKQHLKFQQELELKIETTFSEWKKNAIENQEKLIIEIEKTKAKEAENKRLEQEKLEAYQKHENEIRIMQEKNKELTEQQLAKYNEINNKLEEAKTMMENQKKDYEKKLEKEELSWWKSAIVIGTGLITGHAGAEATRVLLTKV